MTRDPCRMAAGEAAGHRIELVESTSHLRLMLHGSVIADSAEPLLLHETGYPVRYYLSRQDVCEALLVPSDTITHCPYKGEATFYSVVIGDEIVEDFFWCYRRPKAGLSPIAGRLSFLQERAEPLLVDGKPAMQ